MLPMSNNNRCYHEETRGPSGPGLLLIGQWKCFSCSKFSNKSLMDQQFHEDYIWKSLSNVRNKRMKMIILAESKNTI